MGEAVETLQRQVALWSGELKVYERRLEKAQHGSDEAQVAQNGVAICQDKITDLSEALKMLTGTYE